MRIRVRSDILHLYRELHSWVGILAGLFLFVAFYAGAISMFEQPLQDWATHPPALPAPVALSRTPDLVAAALAAHPEAAAGYSVIVEPAGAHPARLEWSDGQRREHARGGAMRFAALDEQGRLVIARQPASAASGFIDVLHQQIGLPLPHAVAMPIMGVIALLYATALISGTLAFLPTLARNLFSLKLFGSAQKAWLDLHNLLGIVSLPFHIVMAVSSVVFAFHEEIFVVQHLTLAAPPSIHRSHAPAPAATAIPTLPPEAVITALQRQVPGLAIDAIDYLQGGRALRVRVHDPRYSLRGPVSGFATLDPASGRILSGDYLPGRQPRGLSIVTVFFALHFGSFGGTPVRWMYLLLGFGGAALFYGGNRLWVVARRRRERRDGRAEDSLGTRLLDRLTPGWSFGCIAGCSAVLAAAPLMADHGSDGGSDGLVAALFYGVFATCVALAFAVPQRLAEQAPLWVAAVLTLALAAIATLARTQNAASLSLALCALLLGTGLAGLGIWSGRAAAPNFSHARAMSSARTQPRGGSPR